MKSFRLNEKHDIDILNNQIQLTEGDALLQQSAECNLNTKIGEWFLDDELGTDLNSLLGKRSIDNEHIKSVILDSLRQVDESFEINDFAASFDSKNRKLIVNSTASTESGEKITIVNNAKQGGVRKDTSSVTMIDGGISISGNDFRVTIIDSGLIVTGG